MIGIKTFYNVLTDIVTASDIVLTTTGLTSPIAAGERQKVKFWVPFTVGATGGVRAQVVVPAGGTSFLASIKLFNTVAPSLTTASQAASAVFTNAAANAGLHWLEIEVDVRNGATAGNVDLQMAQNTSDALSLTIEAGASAEVTIY